MTTVEIILALLGGIGGAYAAFKSDVQVAGLSIILLAAAILLPLILK